MQTNGDTNQRMKELVAKIETEQDPKEFSALVEELNRLLDCDWPAQAPPSFPSH